MKSMIWEGHISHFKTNSLLLSPTLYKNRQNKKMNHFILVIHLVYINCIKI